MFKRKKRPHITDENPFESADSLARFAGQIAVGLVNGTVDVKVANAVQRVLETWSEASRWLTASEATKRDRWIESEVT